jgi:hypothetical protein
MTGPGAAGASAATPRVSRKAQRSEVHERNFISSAKSGALVRFSS